MKSLLLISYISAEETDTMPYQYAYCPPILLEEVNGKIPVYFQYNRRTPPISKTIILDHTPNTYPSRMLQSYNKKCRE
jgi:hypothetical protein